MKNFILLLAFATFSSAISAQILSFNTEEMFVEGLSNELNVPAKFDVANETADNLNFMWRLERADVPDEWVFTICDAFLCHAAGVEVCPQGEANSIMANAEINGLFKVSVKPNEVPYNGHIFFVLTNPTNSNEEYARLKINIDIGMFSSTFDFNSEDLTIYPNPASDFIQLKHDQDVNSIAVYDLIGREVYHLNHFATQTHDISKLKTGIYLIKLFDKDMEEIKTVSLAKQ